MAWVTVKESSRTYIFGEDHTHTFHDVCKVEGDIIGVHKLQMEDGSKAIVSADWLIVLIDGDWP
jgi:hypothetical protein